MKKIFSTPLIIFFFSIFHSYGQNCGTDSVVVSYSRDNSYYNENYMSIDSFNLATGASSSCTKNINNSLTNNCSCYQHQFVRKFLLLNTSRDTTQFILMNGTGTGFTNTTRVDFIYNNITHKIINRKTYSGNGNLWNLSIDENWSYDANNKILSYTGNNNKTTYNYLSSRLISILYEVDHGSGWENDKSYQFTYGVAGIRDSLYIKKWDTISQTWNDSIQSMYNPADGYLAECIRSEPSLDTTYNYIDTVNIKLDTLNNIIKYYERVDSTHSEYIYEYEYVNNHLVKTYDFTNDDGCINYSQLSYDSNGVNVGYNGGSHCFMPMTGSGHTNYDMNYRPVSSTSMHSSNTNDGNHYTEYFYPSINNINFFYVPLEDIGGFTCRGESIRPNVVINGGCGPYHFTWSPSTGLSSDTIAEPIILLNDSITYTISVTDSTGHGASTTFFAVPNHLVDLIYDESTCQGCPVLLRTEPQSSNLYKWFRNGIEIPGATGDSLVADTSGSYYAIALGSWNSCDAISDTVHLTIYSDTRITGRVYLDIDSDCVFSGADRPLSMYGTTPFLIKVEKPGYSSYMIPDSSGFYDFPADTGIYHLTLFNFPSIFQSACPANSSITVAVQNHGDTINGNDFSLNARYNCSRLGLSISSGILRACMPVNISVNYFNEGILDENNAVVNIIIPNELTVTSSQLPYTILSGNKYEFALPPLLAGSSGSFNLSADVSCNVPAIANATLCLDGDINPINFCSLNADSTWDGSNIRVSSYCNNDSSVCFIIKNEGLSTGNMHDSSTWYLYANNLMIGNGTFKLDANHDTILCFSSTGKTYRLEANQLIGFPSLSLPRAFIERCGTLDSGQNYSLNQILQYPLDNNLPFYYTYCGLIRSSIDPNEKSIEPEGWSINHFISNNDRLKYRIDFQNSGNDTAFFVQITDRLDTSVFDISTLNLLSTSHPFTTFISGNMVVWSSGNILLPDSNINELASHGYVEFSINTKPLLQNGSIVRNTANIKFDFNPIITTEVITNTICETKQSSVTIHEISFCEGDSAIYIADIMNGGINPGIAWQVNGIQYATGQDTIQIQNLNLNDTVECIINSNYMCALPRVASSNKILFTNSQVIQPSITYNSPNLLSSAANSYQWYYNNMLIVGAELQSYTPVNDGQYQVQTWDAFGCTAMSAEFNFVHSGIPNTDINKISIYPNPSDNFILITGLSVESKIKLTDVTGKEIEINSVQDENSNSLSLDVKKLKSALYFIQIISGDKSFYKTVFVLHER